MVELINIIVSGFSQIGMNAAKKHLGNRINAVRLKKILNDYIKRNWNSYEECNLNEEMDFQGLIDYINHNLLDDVVDYFWGTTSKIRSIACETIIRKAVAYAQPMGEDGIKLITKYLNDLLGILREFFNQKVDEQLWYVARVVEDDINQKNEETTAKQTDELAQLIREEGKLTVDEIKEVLAADNEFSLETYEQYASAGDLDAVRDNLAKINTRISTSHPLFPDYGYKILGDRPISFPLSEDAIKKYPPNIHVKGSLFIEDSPVMDLYTKEGENIAHYADRHQLGLKIKVQEAQKRLGDQLDPNQIEAERLIGATLIRQPTPFQEARPVNVLVDGNIWCEYVELRTREILDDGTFVLSNEEQKNNSLKILARINPNTGGVNFSFRFKPDGVGHRETLKALKSTQTLYRGKLLTLHNLNTGEDFLCCDISDFDTYETGFDSIEEEIDFISRICDIENYFKKSIYLPDIIEEEDYNAVCFLSDLIHGEERETRWKTFSIECIMNKKIKDAFEAIPDGENSGAAMDILADATIELFGEKYAMKVRRCYQSARICNIKELQKKISSLDNGETFGVAFEPGSSDVAIDSLISPEI